MSDSPLVRLFLRARRSPWTSATFALVGFGLIGAILERAGWGNVGAAIARAAHLFPLVLLLEGAILACSVCALRLLYGEDRHRLPAGALVRAGLIGYAVTGFLPAGRAVGESARAVCLTRYASAPRAWAAAVSLQGISLVANAAVSVLAGLALLAVTGASLMTLLVAANGIGAAALGMGIILAGRRSRAGTRLGRWLPRAQAFGHAFDAHLQGERLLPPGPLLWECGGRMIQVIQYGVLVLAAGGALGLLPALCAEGLHLIGAAVGDLIPAQLGATEAGFALWARVLSLTPSDAVSIALLAHLARLIWMSIALGVQALGGWDQRLWGRDEAAGLAVLGGER